MDMHVNNMIARLCFIVHYTHTFHPTLVVVIDLILPLSKWLVSSLLAYNISIAFIQVGISIRKTFMAAFAIGMDVFEKSYIFLLSGKIGLLTFFLEYH